MVSEGLFYSLKVDINLNLTMDDYYKSLQVAANLWIGLMNRRKVWSESTLNDFIKVFMITINDLL